MTLRVRCVIVGGGPAGMMAGMLLARAGVDVCVLEKHADFLRDFRGDTIHPSTLEVMAELGLLESFLREPHQEVTRLSGNLGDTLVTIADFAHVGARCRFLAFMPQWEFLNFLAGAATAFPRFGLRMRARVTELLWDGDRVAGVRAQTPAGPFDVRADLTIAADGRESIVRAQAGLEPVEYGAPMDVLWLRLSKRSGDPSETFGYIRAGRIMALIDRGAYWQCAYVIAKGSLDRVHARGLVEFRGGIASTAPFLRDRVGELRDWDDVKLLTVRVNRLERWYRAGLLCIGDSAHAMSPIGGVGINLAIQDAVATANLLAGKLRHGAAVAADLRGVQRRRELPARLTQALQLFVQKAVIGRVLDDGRAPFLNKLPLVLRYLPFLPRITGRLVGLGFRPEHVAFAPREEGRPQRPRRIG